MPIRMRVNINNNFFMCRNLYIRKFLFPAVLKIETTEC